MTVVDSHLHVWRAAERDIPTVQTMVPPETDVPIESARRTMTEHKVDRAVLVQPVFRGEDNAYVAECVRAEPDRLAAVCVVDPRVEEAAARLEHWVHEGCRGLRLRPRLEAEARVFGDPATYPLWEAAERLGVVISLLASPEHVPAIDRLAERYSSVPIVIDHLGHPDPSRGAGDALFRALLELARHPRVSLKLSGFHHFSRERFPYADCRPLVRAAYEHFGPQRLLWGSDFPHVLVACGYARSLAILDDVLPEWSSTDRAHVMGGTALRLYWPQ